VWNIPRHFVDPEVTDCPAALNTVRQVDAHPDGDGSRGPLEMTPHIDLEPPVGHIPGFDLKTAFESSIGMNIKGKRAGLGLSR